VSLPRARWRQSSVVLGLDPGDDREAEIVSVFAAAGVEDVVPQQAENHSMLALSPAP
jgi:hypothetical protein